MSRLTKEFFFSANERVEHLSKPQNRYQESNTGSESTSSGNGKHVGFSTPKMKN